MSEKPSQVSPLLRKLGRQTTPLPMKRFFTSAFVLCGLVALIGCNQATQLAQNIVTINASWEDNAVEHRDNLNIQYTYVCPPNPSKTGVGTVWGTDTYSDDSSVCAAGVHAGDITFNGGSITIGMRGGLESYTGSTRNGVTTQDWGSWSGSFVVL